MALNWRMYAEGLTHTRPVILSTPVAGVTVAVESTERSRETRQPVALLGVAFDNLTLLEAVARIEEMIASGRSHHVVTANVDFLAQAHHDVELQRILLDASLVLCDGTPLVWASRLFGNPLPERVAGADIVPVLIDLAALKGYRLFFLGATEEANAQATGRLRAQFPTLEISHFSPAFRPLLELDDAEILRRIHAAKPDMLFVAFGCPKAEKWLAMHRHELGVPVTIGVGATIDFLAGHVSRAPRWMQRGGAEWAYRLCQEPRRLFKRYATDLRYLGAAVVHQWWTRQVRFARRRDQTRTAVAHSSKTWHRVEAARFLTVRSTERDRTQWQEIAGADRHCLLELAGVQRVDSTGIGVLLHLRKTLHLSGRQLILLSPSTTVRRALKAMRLEEYFEIAANAFGARAIIKARAREQTAPAADGLADPPVLTGAITSSSAEHIAQCTWSTINRAKPDSTSLSISLETVRLIDSGGSKLLLHAVETARSQGISLRFSNPSRSVRNVLQLSNLDHLVDQSV